MDENNLFKNSADACGGLFVLFIFPFISLGVIIVQFFSKQPPTFLSYSYPVATLCLSDAYDAWGRKDNNKLKNAKLYTRIAIDIVAFLAALGLSYCSMVLWLHYIPISLLPINGLLLIRDMVYHWRISLALPPLEQKGVDGDEEKRHDDVAA